MGEETKAAEVRQGSRSPLAKVKAAIRSYHFSRDTMTLRGEPCPSDEMRRMAVIEEIENALDMPYERDQESKRRLRYHLDATPDEIAEASTNPPTRRRRSSRQLTN